MYLHTTYIPEKKSAESAHAQWPKIDDFIQKFAVLHCTYVETAYKNLQICKFTTQDTEEGSE